MYAPASYYFDTSTANSERQDTDTIHGCDRCVCEHYPTAESQKLTKWFPNSLFPSYPPSSPLTSTNSLKTPNHTRQASL